jgi:CubicO group peptidase (beta-lactamase class C family)
MFQPNIQGTCDPRFTAVKERLQHHFTTGRNLGASICVNLNGTNVVDIWGGHANADHTKAWEENTITNIWSTTKVVTALAALLLIDRGLLDPDEKVAKYWPEFSANGKEDVKVWMVLSHASGLSTWASPVTMTDVFNYSKSTKMLEQQAPLWPPGTQSGYHGLTMGHLIDELVRRVTGKSLQQFIQDELAGPLGADFQLGAKEEDWKRCADIIPPPPFDPAAPMPDEMKDPNSIMFRSLTNPILDPAITNTPAWRKAELGAANGFSNARGITRILSPVSLGGSVDGKQILRSETIERIFEERIKGEDLVIRKPMRFGLGFAVVEKGTWADWTPEGKVATWGGLGGSIAVMDVERGLTVSYVMNRMENHIVEVEVDEEGVVKRDRFREYVDAVYGALGG